MPDTVAPSGRIAAIYTGSKYFAYLPVKGNGVYMADMTSPTGSPSAANPMQTSFAIGWQSGTTPGKGARLSAAQVTIPGYSKHLLIGSTALDQVLHVAEINTSNGNVSEVATAPTQSIAVAGRSFGRQQPHLRVLGGGRGEA